MSLHITETKQMNQSNEIVESNGFNESNECIDLMKIEFDKMNITKTEINTIESNAIGFNAFDFKFEPYVWKETEPFVYKPPTEVCMNIMNTLKSMNSINTLNSKNSMNSKRRKTNQKNVKKSKTTDSFVSKLEYYQNISAGLTMIPALFGMENLRTLDLSYNQIREVLLPYDSKITHLTLNHNKIDKIKCLPKNLHVLEISHNEIHDNSWKIIWDCYPSLVKIVMNHNKMNTLQGRMPPQLVHLACSYNQLNYVNIISPSLKNLILERNQLDSVLFVAPLLHLLNLKNNENLETLPDLSNMLFLKYLNASRTGLNQTDDNEDMVRPFDLLPDTIEELLIDDLSIDRLTFLPKNLKRLSCSECGIEEIDGLDQLKGLVELNCSYNHIIQLKVPPSLETLYCHNNDIEVLDIPYRNMLKHVNCSSNRLKLIEHVPIGIREVRHFIYHKNPLFFLNPFILRHPITIPVLRSISLARNVSHVIHRIFQNPDHYNHLIGTWGPIHDSIRKGIQSVLDKCQTDECPICYCSIDSTNRCITSCLHGYCMDCCEKIVSCSCCPMCRETMEWKHHAGPMPRPKYMLDAYHPRLRIHEAFDRFPTEEIV